jgi:predicted phosphodiesterase
MNYPNPDEQVERVTELLKPISKHVLMLCDGNHEDRSQRTSGLTPSKYIAKSLDVPYVGYHGMLELGLHHRAHREIYNIYAEHGCGSIPKQVGGRYSKLESIQKQVEADIYLKGHIHHKCTFPKKVWKKVNGTMVARKIMFAANGSYLIDAEYAIRSGFEPTEPGVAKVLLSTKDFNIHSSI